MGYAAELNRKRMKAPTSEQNKEFIRMMGEVTYGDRLEMFRAIHDPNDPEDVKTLKDYEKLVKEKGRDTLYP